MKHKVVICWWVLAVALVVSTSFKNATVFDKITSYTANLKKQQVRMYWKNGKGEILGSLGNLKNEVESKHQKLLMAMNGGMYMENQAPLGLYIENKKQVSALNKRKGSGNFYMEPNGVFFITDNNEAGICTTASFEKNTRITYATQSGPMLVVNGELNKEFRKGSSNLNIRNGVGILPNGEVVFAISTLPINFYDFASFFQNLGCKNALYLDGAISRMYCPEQHLTDLGGSFGVMIGVSE